jgi:hypothetical protein
MLGVSRSQQELRPRCKAMGVRMRPKDTDVGVFAKGSGSVSWRTRVGREPTRHSIAMPNWCEFDLSISGDPREVRVFEAQLLMKERDGMVSLLSTFIPMPEALVGTVSPKQAPYNQHRVENASGKELEAMLATNAEYEAEYLELVKTYGAGDWHSWAISNWGTKWADRVVLTYRGPRSIRATGECPWSPPLEGLLRISEQWPNLRIGIEWFEAGGGFAGKAVFRGGNINSRSDREYRGGRGG